MSARRVEIDLNIFKEALQTDYEYNIIKLDEIKKTVEEALKDEIYYETTLKLQDVKNYLNHVENYLRLFGKMFKNEREDD